jgi:hypothetical protein
VSHRGGVHGRIKQDDYKLETPLRRHQSTLPLGLLCRYRKIQGQGTARFFGGEWSQNTAFLLSRIDVP